MYDLMNNKTLFLLLLKIIMYEDNMKKDKSGVRIVEKLSMPPLK
jgi:hypothetical protein